MTLFLAAPFILPIPLPGVSMPFGIMIMIFGGALATGWDPYLPKRLLDRPLPGDTVRKLSRSASKVFRKAEKYLKPRLDWAISNPVLHALAGGLIAFSGLLLALPLPPGTNAPPALCILLLAAALLERDGLMLFFGFAAFLGNVAFFAILGYFGYEAYMRFLPFDFIIKAFE